MHKWINNCCLRHNHECRVGSFSIIMLSLSLSEVKDIAKIASCININTGNTGAGLGRSSVTNSHGIP